ncbi:MAG: HAD superfamily hydrolase (TIGR01484 family) [Oceanicoccus sp.]|jgi:HAD superfamily hydrolase (TIGR01484 family)
MKFKTLEQKRAYEKAMNRSYKAAAFDVDGTITEFAKLTIPDSLLATFEQIPLDVPLAICTGRPIEFIHRKMDAICNATRNPAEQRRRWWIIAENGGAGYYFDEKTEEYVQFFDIKWPVERIEMEVLVAYLKDKLGGHVNILKRKHTVVVIYPKWMYLFPHIVKRESRRNSNKIRKVLKDMGLSNLLSSQDSGLGTLIVPKESGKGNAIRHFAKKLGIPMKQILCVGDSPQSGGNDEDFMSGHFGTPFNVGPLTKKNYPLPVLDARGVRLTGPQGTEALLKQVF